MTELTVGSLFSGIGGFELGFERAGMSIKWQCEIDEFCQKVLAKHWPKAERYKDVKGLRPTYVDVLCGGFPCQDISVAGRQAGITGARSGLWSEFVRIASEIRPKYLVAENVSALKAKGLNTVLADLAACGYDAEWQCIPASALGAYHQRDRIWIVAYPNSSIVREQQNGVIGSEGKTELGNDGKTGQLADANSIGCDWWSRQSQERTGWAESTDSSSGSWPTDPKLADTTSKGLQRRAESTATRKAQSVTAGGCFPARLNAWNFEPSVGRVADGIPDRVDRTKSLGNALVPQIAEWIGERIVARENTQEQPA